MRATDFNDIKLQIYKMPESEFKKELEKLVDLASEACDGAEGKKSALYRKGFKDGYKQAEKDLEEMSNEYDY